MFKLPNGFDIGPYLLLIFAAFLFYWFYPEHMAQRSPSPPKAEVLAPEPVSVPVPVAPEPVPEPTRGDVVAPPVVPPPAPVPEVLPSTPAAPLPQGLERRSAIQPGEHPRVAVVIDDLGVNAAATNAAIDLPPEVALSFLPYGVHTADLARVARTRGHEVLLHLPMQPVGQENPGPDALTADLSDAELAARVQRAFAAVPGVIGVNNHMGSRMTAEVDRLLPVMREIKKHGVFFLDSKTSPRSRALAVAYEQGIPVLGRDIFLDDVITEAEVRRELAQLEAVAVERSSAIAIGHPHPTTLAVLRPWLQQLAARGFTLVRLEALLPRT